MIKNVAGKWLVHAFNAFTGAAVTGDAANITANLRLDFGASNPVDDTNPQELERGDYYFDITQAEANADHIAICPVSATPNVIVVGSPPLLYTESDFTATMKTSLNAATPASIQNIPATGSGFTALGDTRLANLDGKITDVPAGVRTSLATELARIDAAISSRALGVGTGPVAQEYTLTVGGIPCADATVIMTTDAAVLLPIHSGLTNALGKVTFYPNLPAGTTVYLWRFKTGDDFTATNPDSEVIHV